MLKLIPVSSFRRTYRYCSKTTRSIRAMSSEQSRPNGLIANKGIELLTFGTPNGHKISILLEELKEAYGKDYTFQNINIGQNIQKEEWFTKVCPNGRIPAIVDHDRGDFGVFESSAIAYYLVRHYDPQHKFSFTDPDDVSRCEQWVEFLHGGIGPMQGQCNHFYRLGPERIPYPTQRYLGETERLFGVLDKQLENRDYLTGSGRGKYSIADMMNFGWVNFANFAGIDLASFKNLHAWQQKIMARPAVEKGCAIPNESQMINSAYQRRLKEEEGFPEKERELKELGDKAKQAYNYKFKSP